eukprot:scaffold847_cov385-Prasinococcus_capsulatus_cf.AAC.1
MRTRAVERAARVSNRRAAGGGRMKRTGGESLAISLPGRGVAARAARVDGCAGAHLRPGSAPRSLYTLPRAL